MHPTQPGKLGLVSRSPPPSLGMDMMYFVYRYRPLTRDVHKAWAEAHLLAHLLVYLYRRASIPRCLVW